MIIRPANMKDCPVIYALYQSEKLFSFTSLLNLPSQKSHAEARHGICQRI